MSEYQYYEFVAIDRPLSEKDRKDLRAISTRAEITTTSFTNHYEWGDLKADPLDFMKQWFDLHVYVSNWGTQRLMIRLPKQLVDRSQIEAARGDSDSVQIIETSGHLILDMVREEVELLEFADDGSGWMDELRPLRADILAGDHRLLYLMWLIDVQDEMLEEDTPEPLQGIGPLTPHLKAAAKFFYLDDGIVSVAAQREAVTEEFDSNAVRELISAIPNEDKTELLAKVFEADPQAARVLQAQVRGALEPTKKPQTRRLRTAAELRARAEKMRGKRSPILQD